MIGIDLMKNNYQMKLVYNGLNMEEISGIDYRHTEKVFNKFNIKN